LTVSSNIARSAVGQFALAYSKETEQDHATLEKARRSGRIKVASGKV
jgi:hypothetical protein